MRQHSLPPPMVRHDTPHKIPLRKRELERSFIAAVAVVISVLFMLMIADYLAMLFLAAVLTMLLQRPHEWLTARLGGRMRLSACLIVFAVALAVVFPACLILRIVVEQTGSLGKLIAPWVQRQVASIQEMGIDGLEWLPVKVREEVREYQATIMAQISDLASKATPILVRSLQASTASVGTVLAATLNFLFLCYTLVFFLLSGKETFHYAASLMPIPAVHRTMLVAHAHSTILATVRGSLLIALVQGSLTGCGLILAGVPLAFLWAAVATLFSIVPLIGTSKGTSSQRTISQPSSRPLGW